MERYLECDKSQPGDQAQVIELLTGYNARVKVVYVEASHDAFFAQNFARNAVVPASAIDRMLSRWEVPDPTEAQEADWWVDQHPV